jgi:hypothetical protein
MYVVVLSSHLFAGTTFAVELSKSEEKFYQPMTLCIPILA